MWQLNMSLEMIRHPLGDKIAPGWEPTLNIHWKDWCWSSSILATWCEELTHWKNPDTGKIEGRRRRRWRRMRWLDGMNVSLSKLQKMVKDREACSPWGHKESDTSEWRNKSCYPGSAIASWWTQHSKQPLPTWVGPWNETCLTSRAASSHGFRA